MEVLVGLVAILLVGISTVLALRPGPERFENLFATILAYWYSAYKVKVGSALPYARGPVRMGMR